MKPFCITNDIPISSFGTGCNQNERPKKFNVGRRCRICHRTLSRFNPNRVCFCHHGEPD